MRSVARGVGAVLAVAVTAAGATVTPQDFAYGMTLRTAGGDGLYRLSVPGAVYETVASPSLADVRVFNASGEAVPHAIRVPEADGAGEERAVRVPFFPLRGEAGTDGGRLTVTTNEGGSVVSIQRDGSAGEARTTAYLLDLSTLEHPVDEIRLSVAPADGDGADGLNARLAVEASDDLGDWRTLRRGAPLIRLDYEGRRLERTTVDLPAVKARYLRLSWPETARGYRLTGVQAVDRREARGPPLSWLSPPGAAHEAEGEFRYDTGGRYPVRRVDVRPGYDNAVMDVTVESRPDGEAPWRRRFRGEVYRVQLGGTRLRSEPRTIVLTRDRYWRVRV
ncbi:DUF3999 domain-containing protein, partial [Ectothiorhodospiraceae bacterium WFHF3C12]|nr:DUF3999 domain-containing protein [Ectothiorhodospiraceae bacterium WFHF3C12]